MQHNNLIIGIQTDLRGAFRRFQRLVGEAVTDRKISFHCASEYNDLVDEVTKSSDRDTDIILIHESPYPLTSCSRGKAEHLNLLSRYNRSNDALRDKVAHMAQLEFVVVKDPDAAFPEPSDKTALLEKVSESNLPLQLPALEQKIASQQFLEFLSWFDKAVEEKKCSIQKE